MSEGHIHSPRRIQFGLYEVDLKTGELCKSGVKLKLSGQPFQVLAILLEHPGEIVSREELQERLWPNTFVDVDHSLNTAVNKIREVLGDSPENPRSPWMVARWTVASRSHSRPAERARVHSPRCSGGWWEVGSPDGRKAVGGQARWESLLRIP